MARHQRRLAVLVGHVDSVLRPPGEAVVTTTPTASEVNGVTDGLGYAVAAARAQLFGRFKETEKHGGQLVASVLRAHGVRFLFTLIGGHISPLIVASEQVGIRIVDVRHEVTSVFAADAVGRLTGVPGVCAVTAGPGITNTVTAVKNAQLAQSPVVLLGGAASTLLKGRGALQDIDQMVLLRPIVKWCASCSSVRDIVPALRRAFQEAASGVPGPVFVELPIDVLYPINEIRSQMGMMDRWRSPALLAALKDGSIKESEVALFEESTSENVQGYLSKRNAQAPAFTWKNGGQAEGGFLVSKYMSVRLKHLFADGFTTTDFAPLTVTFPVASERDITAAAALLLAAQRPVLVVGSQCMLLRTDQGQWAADAAAEKLANAILFIGAPTFLGGMARGMLGRNCRTHIRQNRGAALRKADLVILLGAITDFRMGYGKDLSRQSQIIAVNRSPEDLQLNTDVFWKPTLALEADPCNFAIALAETLRERTVCCPERFASWAGELKAAEDMKEARNAEMARGVARGHGSRDGVALLNPLSLLSTLEEILPEDSVLVADGGDFVATASYIVRPRGPLRWLDPGAFGTLGVGGGFALAAKLLRPESEVWLLWGDGSAGYSIAEFDTFKRHSASVIALIGNDACWTQIEREQVPIFGASTGCPLDYSEYHTVAMAYGSAGLEISSPEDNVRGALQKAQSLAAAGTPVVINAHIGSTSFREGSLSV